MLSWILIFTAATAYTMSSNHDLAVSGREAHDALCVVRGNEARQLERSRAFLVAHPKGVEGIATRAELLVAIADQDQTVRALGTLSCP